MTIYDFLPKFIKRIIADKPRQTITAEQWNEYFNLLIAQGDHGQEALQAVMNQLKTNVLFKDNEDAWEPTNDYHPATVKFVTDWAVELGAGDMLKTIYDNNENGIVDDAEKLGGQPPEHYAVADHIHENKADLVGGKIPLAQIPELTTTPTTHASSTTTYGVGSTAAYGHCKIIDNLTKTTYASGEVLSAKQGNVLKVLTDGKASNSHTHKYAGSSTAGGDALNALKVGGKAVWVGLEANKGTDANTIYFCS